MHHDSGDSSGKYGVALELLCLTEREQYRQEVEHCISKKVDDVVGLCFAVDDVEHNQQGH